MGAILGFDLHLGAVAAAYPDYADIAQRRGVPRNQGRSRWEDIRAVATGKACVLVPVPRGEPDDAIDAHCTRRSGPVSRPAGGWTNDELAIVLARPESKVSKRHLAIVGRGPNTTRSMKMAPRQETTAPFPLGCWTRCSRPHVVRVELMRRLPSPGWGR